MDVMKDADSSVKEKSFDVQVNLSIKNKRTGFSYFSQSRFLLLDKYISRHVIFSSFLFN